MTAKTFMSRLPPESLVCRQSEGVYLIRSDTLRSVTKTLTLGISYGLTVYGFIRQIEDDLGIRYEREEAERFFETFFEMFPQIAAAHAKAAEDALSLDSVRTVTGQRRFLPPLLDDDGGNGYWPSLERRKRVIINTPIQGSAASLLIRAVNKFMPRLPAGVETINLVHDEVDLLVTSETLPKTVQEVGKAFDKAFRELYGTQLKVKLDYRVGSSWANGEKYVP
jgi:DNA polymerase-1